VAPEAERPSDLLLSDPDLLRRFLQGEQAATATVTYHYAPLAGRVISAIIKNPIEAQDVLQDTLVQLLLKRKQYECRRPFAAFVARVARNRALDALRRRKRSKDQPYDETTEPSAGSFEEELLAQEEVQQRDTYLRELGAFRESLDTPDQELLDLQYGEKLGRDRLSDRLGQGEKKVRNRMKALRERVSAWVARTRGEHER
jgi:RNA polymerase sigma-70 factor (ECF subfamily)